jgi:UDP-N-acetylenolpyruvoylglucosamine reductase
MKKTKYTEEQIAFALKQAEAGTPVGEVIRKMWYFGADLLQLEEEIWWPGIVGAAASQAARTGEPSSQADSCRSES